MAGDIHCMEHTVLCIFPPPPHTHTHTKVLIDNIKYPESTISPTEANVKVNITDILTYSIHAISRFTSVFAYSV